ncbi:hypothetical protein HL273_14415 [Yersinia enterocolitica]|uniref:hypothetical protein n=1 Tax=Yersinia enterocolitica TaxID=630 RepID=UPI00155A93BE|nr:hypothetical protein [Yersinia enterocolitica]NQS96222.1 hypothetical protein [Yersinia enterocolitica]NQT44473.1 hypothetical protein [Yersinia enterocolitica]NQU02016.1 hypothetical protein [Yersinia enterocolitica]
MLSKAELNLSTDALTVEQAIEHALAVYEQNDCNMCGRQHKQLANWLTELLSLREQLAELKAFISNECFIIDPEDDENCIRAEYHTKYGELFTAAKPAED